MTVPVKVFTKGEVPDQHMAVLPEAFEIIRERGLESSYSGLKGLILSGSPSDGRPSFYSPADDTITLQCPNFRSTDRLDLIVYRAIGRRHWQANLSNAGRVTWQRMYQFVSGSASERVVQAFMTGSQFSDVIAGLTRAVDRLIAVHVANALSASSITPLSLQSGPAALTNHPSVSGLLSGSKPFSLIPLVSAYGDYDNLKAYEKAFMEYCAEGSFRVYESSTRDSLKELFLKTSSEA